MSAARQVPDFSHVMDASATFAPASTWETALRGAPTEDDKLFQLHDREKDETSQEQPRPDVKRNIFGIKDAFQDWRVSEEQLKYDHRSDPESRYLFFRCAFSVTVSLMNGICRRNNRCSCALKTPLFRKKTLEARVGIEPTHKGFADLSLTTWVPRLDIFTVTCSARKIQR